MGFTKSGFASYIFTDNRLGCLGPTFPPRTTKILDKYLNVFFKSLRATKEGKNDKFKRQEKKNSREMILAFRASFLLRPIFISKLSG